MKNYKLTLLYPINAVIKQKQYDAWDLQNAQYLHRNTLPVSQTFHGYVLVIYSLSPRNQEKLHFWNRRSIPLAPALPTFGDERAIGARLQPATDKMLIAPEALNLRRRMVVSGFHLSISGA
jgi:hypothetical protein